MSEEHCKKEHAANQLGMTHNMESFEAAAQRVADYSSVTELPGCSSGCWRDLMKAHQDQTAFTFGLRCMDTQPLRIPSLLQGAQHVLERTKVLGVDEVRVAHQDLLSKVSPLLLLRQDGLLVGRHDHLHTTCRPFMFVATESEMGNLVAQSSPFTASRSSCSAESFSHHSAGICGHLQAHISMCLAAVEQPQSEDHKPAGTARHLNNMCALSIP